ncbi:MAG: hypothetical protein H7325_05155, partial [Pedobacter sp.]|nr:hypothetical protein [Pedobacter sp.]
MKIAIIFLLFATTLLITSCKKDDGLTRETQTGANTFSCKVNGALFIPHTELFAPPKLSVQAGTSFGTPILKIYAANHNVYVEAISFDFRDFKGKGYYVIDSPSDTKIDFRLKILYSDSRVAEKGFVNITRYDNHIVSGTFEF